MIKFPGNAASIVDAERELKRAYDTDVRPVIEDWREAKPTSARDPLLAFRESGYQEAIAQDRKKRRQDHGHHLKLPVTPE